MKKYKIYKIKIHLFSFFINCYSQILIRQIFYELLNNSCLRYYCFVYWILSKFNKEEENEYNDYLEWRYNNKNWFQK